MSVENTTMMDKMLVDNKLENFIKKYVNMEHYHTLGIRGSSHFTFFLVKLLMDFENIVYVEPKKFIEYDFLYKRIFNNFDTKKFKELCITKLINKGISIENNSFRNHMFYDLDNEKLLIFIRITVNKKGNDSIEELIKKAKKVNNEIKNMLNKISNYKVENLKYDKDFVIKELNNINAHLTLSFGISIDFEDFTKMLKLDKLFSRDEVENLCFSGLTFMNNNKLIEINELLDFFRKVIHINEKDIEINEYHTFIYPNNSIKVEIVDGTDNKVRIMYIYSKAKNITKPIAKFYDIPVITEKQLELLQKSMYLYLKSVLSKSNKEKTLQKLLKIVRKIEKEARIFDFLIS